MASPGEPGAGRVGREVTRSRPGWAMGLVAIVIPYLFGFALAGYTAVQLLAGRSGDIGLTGWPALGLAWALTIVGIVTALIVARTVFKLDWAALGFVEPGRPRWAYGVLLTCAAYFLMWVAFLIFGFIHRIGEPALPPVSELSRSAPYVLAYSLLAGIGEELLIMAVPVAVMNALRWPWMIQVLILIILRIPFHLYYGYTAILLSVVWSILFWLLYRRYRWIWPLVAAHTLYDCVASSGSFGVIGSLGLRLGAVLMLLIGAGIIVWQFIHDRRKPVATAGVNR